jgi:maltose O-acetyltransferase
MRALRQESVTAGAVKTVMRRLQLAMVRLSASEFIPGKTRRRIMILAGVAVGPDTRICARLLLSDGVDFSVGADCFINRELYVSAADTVTIQQRVYVGPRVSMLASTHTVGPATQRAGEWVADKIEVGEGSWIGAGAIILAGVSVAPGCVIAAGAVVAKSTAPDGLYGGVPARRLRDL